MLVGLAGCTTTSLANREPTFEPHSPPDQESASSPAESADGEVTGVVGLDQTEDGSTVVDGFFSTRYRHRSGAGEDDNDVYNVFSVNVGDPYRSDVTWHAMGRVAMGAPKSGDSVFFSLEDTFGTTLTGRLYHAYADFHRVDGLGTLRVGRQQIYETPEVAYFDGVRMETEESTRAGLQFGAYGGMPVYPFKESSQTGDALFGAFAQSRPWTGGRVRIDWMYFDDDNLLGEHENELLAFGLWQSLGSFSLDGSYSRLDGDSRDFRVAGRYFDVEGDLSLEASYYELLMTQRDLAVPLDPFYSTLFEYFPFYQAGLLASKGFANGLRLQAGVDVRRVSDEDDEGEFNHDFDRYYLTVGVNDMIPEDIVLTVTGEIWDNQDDAINTFVLDLAKQFSESVEASLGSYYSLFKYDSSLDEEQENVWVYFLRFRHRMESMTLSLRYDFEDSDLAEFHTLRVEATWHF